MCLDDNIGVDTARRTSPSNDFLEDMLLNLSANKREKSGFLSKAMREKKEEKDIARKKEKRKNR